MSNRLAVTLALLAALAVVTDLLLGTGVTLALLRRFVLLVDWLMFWR